MDMQKSPLLLRKFLSGEIQFGAWNVVSKGIGLANSFLIISALSVYEYGVFQLFLSAYAVLTDFISWGGFASGTEMLRFIGQKKEAQAKRLFFETNALRLVSAGALWALFFFGAPALAFRYQPNFILLIQIMSFMFLSEVLLAIVKSLINMRLNFRALASRSATGKLFQSAILVGFLLFASLGLREVFLALVISHVLATIIFIPAAIKAWQPWRGIIAARGASILWRIARAHGKWESMRNFASQFVFRIQPWLIKLFISTEAVGIYSVATALAEVVMQVIPRNTLSTLITRIFHEVERARKVFIYGVKYFMLLSVLAAVGAALVMPIVVSFFFPQYSASLPFFYLLLLLVPIKTFLWLTDIFLIVYRQQKFTFFRMLSRNAAGAVLLLISLPTIGLWGVPLTEVFIRFSVAIAGYRHHFSRHFISSHIPCRSDWQSELQSRFTRLHQ